MNEDLKYIFDNTNEWLKFAEAKNAGLLALLAGLIAGLVSIAGDFGGWQAGIFLASEGIFALAVLTCLYSLSPILSDKFSMKDKFDDIAFGKAKTSVNLIFFQSVYRLTEKQFIELFNSRANVSQINPPTYDITTGTHSLDQDLVHQIIINACIANFKYRCFKWTVGLTCGGIVIVAVPLFMHWFKQ